MKIYVHKNNTALNKQFIIPKNASFNCKNWVCIVIDETQKIFTAKKLQSLDIKDDNWDIKENFTFPSSLLSEFLRNDYFEE